MNKSGKKVYFIEKGEKCVDKMKKSNVWSRIKVNAKNKNRINPMTRTKKKIFWDRWSNTLINLPDS